MFRKAKRALVLLDGIPVNDAFGGWIYWDEIPLESIDRIEVVEGGGSNLWGNEAEGGVINIISKRPSETNEVGVLASYGIRNTTQDAVSVNYNQGPIRGLLEGDFFNADGWNIVQSNFRGPIDGTSSSIHELFGGRVEFDPGKGLSSFLRGSFYNENLTPSRPPSISTAPLWALTTAVTRGSVSAPISGRCDTYRPAACSKSPTFADHHRAGIAQRLQARREAGRMADRRVLRVPVSGLNRTDHDLAAVDADPRLQVDALVRAQPLSVTPHILLHAQGGIECAQGMVAVPAATQAAPGGPGGA